jgi:hypothetical protein
MDRHDEMEMAMITTDMPMPEVGALALTRAALGLGVGLLVAGSIPPVARRRAGIVLVTVGVVSTVPLVAEIVRRRRREPAAA